MTGSVAGSLARDPGSRAVPGLIAGAWLAVLAAQATGTAAALHHHALIEGGPPLWIAIPLFLAGWLVMVAAMMLPASLPTIRVVETAARLTRPRRARWAFLAAFGATWAAFGVLAFAGDLVLHQLVDTTPWLAARPWLVEAAVLALAGGYQLAPLKRRSLAACRHLAIPASTASRSGVRAARLGLDHGLACLGSSWALMLLMFAEGFASLWWMAALTGLMVYEVAGRRADRVAAGAGIVLLVLALAVAAGR